mmetsp:Transcript_18020/g.44206  ORF Transcript_18020/g.44206 Transcript_18020/m.44206 type:complete len:81 (+) Transcript_18020:1066-1308(+)
MRADMTVGGLGIEIWVALLVGVATVCTSVMGPCFAKALIARKTRRRRAAQERAVERGVEQGDAGQQRMERSEAVAGREAQ